MSITAETVSMFCCRFATWTSVGVGLDSWIGAKDVVSGGLIDVRTVSAGRSVVGVSGRVDETTKVFGVVGSGSVVLLEDTVVVTLGSIRIGSVVSMVGICGIDDDVAVCTGSVDTTTTGKGTLVEVVVGG